MRWSWRLARFNGAPVEVRWPLALLLAWTAYVGWSQGHVLGSLYATGLLLATFRCIFLEEMGHAPQAQAIGIPVRRIVLLPFGEPVAISLLLCGIAAVLGADESFVRNQGAVQGTAVRAAVRPPTWTMQPAEALTSVLLKAVESLNQSARPVVGETRRVGLVTKRESAAARARPGRGMVSRFMRSDYEHAEAGTDSWRAQQIMLGTGQDALPVLDSGSLPGRLTVADIRAAFVAPLSPLHDEAPRHTFPTYPIP